MDLRAQILLRGGTGKSGASKQVDYLAQVLEPHIQAILEGLASKLTNFTLPPSLYLWRMGTLLMHIRLRLTVVQDGVIRMGKPHPSTCPDMNLLRSIGRRMKQAARTKKQPTTEEVRVAITEKWEALPQDLY